MEPESPQDKNLDEVLKELGVQDEAELQVPAQMHLFHRGPDIEIVRKWFGPQTVLVTVFVLLWCVVLVLVASQLSAWWPVYLLFVAAGFCAVYYAIARWLNQTHIVVSREKITVRHGPLPWVGNKDLEASNLKQVYRVDIELETASGKGGYGTPGFTGISMAHEVYTRTRDGQIAKLLGGLTGLTREQAVFVAQQIEKYLGIQHILDEGKIFSWLHKTQ